jgi:hypothetical protein
LLSIIDASLTPHRISPITISHNDTVLNISPSPRGKFRKVYKSYPVVSTFKTLITPIELKISDATGRCRLPPSQWLFCRRIFSIHSAPTACTGGCLGQPSISCTLGLMLICIPLQVPHAPANNRREDIPPPDRGIAEPGRMQDPHPHHIDVAYQGIVDYHPQPLAVSNFHIAQ